MNGDAEGPSVITPPKEEGIKVFEVGTRVLLDYCDKLLAGTIRSVLIEGRAHQVSYQVFWFNDGELQSGWFPPEELKAEGEPKKFSVGFARQSDGLHE